MSQKESSLHFTGTSERTFDIEAYGDELNFTIDAPWSGSTEGGFGETLNWTLKKEQALELAAFITRHYSRATSP